MAETAAPLADRTMTALAWRFNARLVTFVLRMVVLVVLARLVSVEDFGLISQALIVIGLAGLVSEIGMGPALIQRQQLTVAHIRVAFTVSLLCGLMLMVVVGWGAPLAGAAFGNPEVVPVVRLLSSCCLFTALGTTASSLMQRKLAFRGLFIVEFTSYLIGYGVVGISFAAWGFGVWALVWGPVSEALLRAVLLYLACPHAVRPSLAPREAGQLFHFGAGMTLSHFLNYAALTGDGFIVGRQLGTAALGLYGRAYQLMKVPMSEFSEAVGSVLFPAYAEIQNEQERLRRASLASVFVSALIVFPTLATLAIAAPELLIGVLGDQWAGAVVPLQVLCVGGVFRTIYSLGDSVARACGAVYAQSWRKAVYAGCVIVGSLVGSHWGITGVALGVVVSLGITYVLMGQLQLRLTGASWQAFFWAQVPGLILAAAVAAVGLPLTTLLRATALPKLAIFVIVLVSSFAAATGTGLLLPKRWRDQTSLAALRRVRVRCADALKRGWLKLRQRKTNQSTVSRRVNKALHGLRTAGAGEQSR
jgi:PST family polysaccharide transporter